MRKFLRYAIPEIITVFIFAVLFLRADRVVIAADLSVYDDSLASGWVDWSWDTTRNFGITSPVHSGTYSIAVTYNQAWAGFYLHAGSAIDLSSYDKLSFWIHGGAAGNQQLKIVANGDGSNVYPVTAQASAWTQVIVPLSSLGSPTALSDLFWQETTGNAQQTFYMDDIKLLAMTGPPPPPPPPGIGPDLSIYASAGRHAISEDIYGMNYADEQLAGELHLPVRRWGGNSTSRYNWQNDTHNTGSDWYFENIREDNSNPAALPDGSAADIFVEQDRRTATKTLMTVPLIGWSPKRRLENHPYDCGFKVTKYGAQNSVDPWDTDCGNGVNTDGTTDITGNAPADTSIAIGPDFITAWINHLVNKYGVAAAGGVAYYNLDNEPMLWNSTHRDVHPQPTTYDEMRDRTYQYAAAIKSVDAAAKTLGPVLWGWCAYFYSARDGCSIGTDYQTHGNVSFVPWYLQQMKAYEQLNGVRILDYLDLHYYPQAGGVSLSPAGTSATQALRLRSTRSLWDPIYQDESWIPDKVRLIPRMLDWVNANYPGTKISVSEYNWGALDHINGALAQADVLGIFGREGLDLATLWGPPAADQPGAFSFRIYRNYDGVGSRFGNVSVQATSGDQGSLAVYAAQRSVDSAVTVVIINKTASGLTSNVSLAGFSQTQAAAVYQYSAVTPSAIVRLADQPIEGNVFSRTFPADSITLLIMLPGGTAADFGATQTTGEGPVYICFTDLSVNNPTSWLWDFGDGAISTLQSPCHMYTLAGQYNVSLTASLAGGSVTTAKSDYITISPCSSLQLRVGTPPSFNYDTSIQHAYGIATEGQSIQVQALDFTEDLNMNASSVKLQGGYVCDYSTDSGFTTIKGSITISGGVVSIENIVVQ